MSKTTTKQISIGEGLIQLKEGMIESARIKSGNKANDTMLLKIFEQSQITSKLLQESMDRSQKDREETSILNKALLDLISKKL